MALLGCSGPSDYLRTLHVSERLGAEHVEAAALAVDAWSEASGLAVDVVAGSAPPGEWSLEPGNPPRAAYGQTFWKREVIILDVDRLGTDEHLLLSVVAHELGHAIGADHTSSGLMFSGRDRDEPVCIDESALESLCSVRECQWQRVVCLGP